MSDSTDRPDDVRCVHCREVIGVYEPMIVFSQGVPVRTSRAASRDEGWTGENRCFHASCFAERQPG